VTIPWVADAAVSSADGQNPATAGTV
jgi:hypothetical protein